MPVDWNPDSLAWNVIYYDSKSFEGVKNRVARSDYTGVECIQNLEEVKLIINDNFFNLDIDKAITIMKEAMDKHDIQKLYEFHQIVHDLDYWLINYPIETFKLPPADWHGIYVYFGVLESYKCIE